MTSRIGRTHRIFSTGLRYSNASFTLKNLTRNLQLDWHALIRFSQWNRNEFESALHFFGSTSTISRYGERFRVGQYSLVSCFYAHCAPIAQPFVKVWSRRLWIY